MCVSRMNHHLFTSLSQGRAMTITHPAARRYFMTTTEAVQLVLLSAVMDTPGGEIFVLEPGEAVMITDLAHRLIRLAGAATRTRCGDSVHRIARWRKAA